MPLPMSDYVTDLRSVLDQSMRILQALVDVAATKGFLHAALTAMRLAQMTLQVRQRGGAGEGGGAHAVRDS